jgi:2-octaprenylphenol hydroxylase
MSRRGDFDVAVVGGGLVGPTLAALCGQAGLKVVLLERERVVPWRPEDEPALRVSALTLATRNILASAGIWAGVCERRLAPFRHMEVWDESSFGAISFDAVDLGEPQLGWIAENPVVQSSLYQRLASLGNVELIQGVELQDFERRQDDLRLRLGNGSRLSVRLLVGADGGKSLVRREAGIATRGWSYHQRALVATVSTEEPHADTAWQRFLATGPLAFLPLYDGRCSIVWSTSPEEAERLLELDPEAFGESLGDALAGRLGRVALDSERAAFPLSLQHAQRYVDARLALVGDAAHTVHPLAGQGVNLGILDAACLAELLITARARGHDPGGLPVLRRYERWRKGHNLMMLAAMDGLKRLFAARLPPLNLLRGVGMRLTDRSGIVKRQLARRAMGLDGDLPQTARITPTSDFAGITAVDSASANGDPGARPSPTPRLGRSSAKDPTHDFR